MTPLWFAIMVICPVEATGVCDLGDASDAMVLAPRPFHSADACAAAGEAALAKVRPKRSPSEVVAVVCKDLRP